MSDPDASGFSAATDPWIPVEREGETDLVSFGTALTRAHQLGRLCPEQPLAAAALLRLLVVLAIRTHGIHSADEVGNLWGAGAFDESRVTDYLESKADRFQLFHPTHPFLQVGGLLPASGSPKGASGLLLRLASGNNVPLFSSLTEGDEILLTPAEALVQLVTVLAFDTASIKSGAAGDPAVAGGKTTGNPTGPLGQLGLVVPQGRNLLETILLNVPLVPAAPADLPVWERDLSPAWEQRQPAGAMDLLTWPSRRVRLFPDASGQRVSAAIVAAGDRLHFTPPNLEPHCRWRSTDKDVVAQRPLRWPSGSSAWRGLDSLLALDDGERRTAMVIRQLKAIHRLLGDTYPLSVLCVGVTYGNMSAVIEDVFTDTLPLPLAALRASDADVHDVLIQVSDSADKVRRALNDLSGNLRRLEGGDKLDWDRGVHPGNDAMALLRWPTERLLRGLQRQPEMLEHGLIAWQHAARDLAWQVANPLLDAASAQAFGGRELQVGSKRKRVSLADCEAWFRHALKEALPDASTHSDDERQRS